MGLKASKYVIEVCVPVHGYRIISRWHESMSPRMYESEFEHKRDTTNQPEMKEDWELCRHFMKWANTCRVQAVNISSGHDCMKFVLTFANLNDMQIFDSGLEINFAYVNQDVLH